VAEIKGGKSRRVKCGRGGERGLGGGGEVTENFDDGGTLTSGALDRRIRGNKATQEKGGRGSSEKKN